MYPGKKTDFGREGLGQPIEKLKDKLWRGKGGSSDLKSCWMLVHACARNGEAVDERDLGKALAYFPCTEKNMMMMKLREQTKKLPNVRKSITV